MGHKPVEKIKATQVAREALKAYQPLFWPLSALVLALLTPLVLLSALVPGLLAAWPPSAILVFALFFSLILLAHSLIATVSLLSFDSRQSGQPLALLAALSASRPYLLPVFMSTFALVAIVSCAVYFSALFLVLPGLVVFFLLGARWIVLYPALVLENQANLAAFSRSSELTAGQRGPAFGLMLIIVTLALVLLLLLFLLINASQLPDRQVELLVMTAAVTAISAAVIPLFYLLPACFYRRLNTGLNTD